MAKPLLLQTEFNAMRERLRMPPALPNEEASFNEENSSSATSGRRRRHVIGHCVDHLFGFFRVALRFVVEDLAYAGPCASPGERNHAISAL
ncbi:MAG: hypothetical protein ABI724_16515 [Betaproteobacteria bacterium]